MRGESCSGSRLLEAPWTLPVYWAVASGGGSVSEVARLLGSSRRLAASGVYYAVRLGLIERDSEGRLRAPCRSSIKVYRRGRLFAAVVGKTVLVAKVRGRSVKAYTIPLEQVLEPPDKGKAGYRARIARMVLGLE